MTYYKSKRPVDGKSPIWVIVDENGNIINRTPNKEKLKGLDKEPRKARDTRKYRKYTDEELLNYLKRFYDENGRIPVRRDFEYNPEYPSFMTYCNNFGNWNNALKLVGMDLDTIIKLGNLENNIQKGRQAEIKVINHFKQHPIDLAGENHNSPCDGICPNGKSYDVKSSKLSGRNWLYWSFGTNNKYKDDIEIYYFLAFNSDYTKLEYAWRVPGEMVEKDIFYIAKNAGKGEFNVENMKYYDVTDKFKDIYKMK